MPARLLPRDLRNRHRVEEHDITCMSSVRISYRQSENSFLDSLAV